MHVICLASYTVWICTVNIILLSTVIQKSMGLLLSLKISFLLSLADFPCKCHCYIWIYVTVYMVTMYTVKSHIQFQLRKKNTICQQKSRHKYHYIQWTAWKRNWWTKLNPSPPQMISNPISIIVVVNYSSQYLVFYMFLIWQASLRIQKGDVALSLCNDNKIKCYYSVIDRWCKRSCKELFWHYPWQWVLSTSITLSFAHIR